MLRQTDFEKAQLVLTGWRYGKEYGGHLPAMMIMGCLANRVRCGWGSWLEVIERIPNFAADNIIPTGFPSIWDNNFVKLLHEVESIHEGSGIDVSKGALYWADLRKIERDWFKDKILKDPTAHPRIADCNSLTLFR